MTFVRKKEKEKFDLLIRDALGLPDNSFGYCVLPNRDRDYPKHINGLYYSNEEFDAFCKVMKERYSWIYKSYVRGKGSELVGAPPKMASVASSSRFCYLALRDASIAVFCEKEKQIGRFEFEKDLPVKDVNGTDPQIDAFAETERTVHFLEFKCHEVFDEHEKKLSDQYDPYLERWGIHRSSKAIPFSEFGLEGIGLFDLKQFLTHAVGVASYEANGKRKILSYVYFKPTGADPYLYERLEKEIKTVFDSAATRRICKAEGIELRLYYSEGDAMDGFEKAHPRLVLSSPLPD